MFLIYLYYFFISFRYIRKYCLDIMKKVFVTIFFTIFTFLCMLSNCYSFYLDNNFMTYNNTQYDKIIPDTIQIEKIKPNTKYKFNNIDEGSKNKNLFSETENVLKLLEDVNKPHSLINSIIQPCKNYTKNIKKTVGNYNEPKTESLPASLSIFNKSNHDSKDLEISNIIKKNTLWDIENNENNKNSITYMNPHHVDVKKKSVKKDLSFYQSKEIIDIEIVEYSSKKPESKTNLYSLADDTSVLNRNPL